VFRAKTVFVIGAGASVEVSLPVGAQLLKQIANLTHITFDYNRQASGDRVIVEALKIILNEGSSVDKLRAHLHAGWQLGESAKQAISIDNVIDALEDPEIELIGKLGIARAILNAEAASPMFQTAERHPQSLQLSNFDNTWYSSSTKLLTENVRKSRIDRIFENVEFINFNYDRCLEHYLPLSLGNYYGIPPEAIQEVMQSLVVHRPYGIVGRLPWQHGSGPKVGFGKCSPSLLADVAQQIRTFTERVSEGGELSEIKSTIADADRIVFLGFAFHRQNVELLSQKVSYNTELFGTAFGVSRSDCSVIEDEISNAFGIKGLVDDKRIVLANLTCNDFFNEHWRSLTAEPGDHEPLNLSNRFQLELPGRSIDRATERSNSK
jgi:hypothetical protein